MNTRTIFRALMAERRMHPRGTPDHEYRTRAARKLLLIIRKVPVSQWAE